MKKRVLHFIHGDDSSPMASRSAAFQTALASHYDFLVVHRTAGKIGSLGSFWNAVRSFQPNVIHCFDLAFTGTMVGLLSRFRYRIPLLIDTGDAITALGRALGRSTLSLTATAILEKLGTHLSNQLIVRGQIHQEILAVAGIDSTWIPDMVDCREFYFFESQDLRTQFRLQDSIVIGMIGSLTWSSRYQWCYGLDVIEAISKIQNPAVRGVIVGDGNGLERLRMIARQLNVENRILFLGRIPYSHLPQYINLFDICISTQSNDLPGQVRTTGKLPLYMACGRFILASRVGQASRILSDDMLLDYHGSFDSDYSSRLANRIEMIIEKGIHSFRPELRALALQLFDESVLVPRLAKLYEKVAR
jgi:glycosyltransferase involved in cell wall biosynthesis